MKKYISILLSVVLLICLITGCGGSKQNDYDKAVGLYRDGIYDKALTIFNKLGDYEASQDYRVKCIEKQLTGFWVCLWGGGDDGDAMEIGDDHSVIDYVVVSNEITKTSFTGIYSFNDKADDITIVTSTGEEIGNRRMTIENGIVKLHLYLKITDKEYPYEKLTDF